MPEAPAGSGRRRISTIAGRCLAVAVALQTLVVVCVFTPLQEVSFRWIGLAGVALPVAVGLAAATTCSALIRVTLWPTARRGRCWVLSAVLAAWAVVVVLAAPTLHGMLTPRPARDGAELTILTQNLWYQNEDPDRTARALLARGADVLVLSEYTPEHAAALHAAGATAAYPYRWEEPRPLGDGAAVMSAVPFGDVERLPTWSGGFRTELATDAGAVTLVAVHPIAPSDYWGLQRWKSDYVTLTELLRGGDPRTVVAGDFNADGAHRRLRGLMSAASLQDAQDVSGAGFAATWPGTGWVPPVMRLDRVLVGEALGVDEVQVLEDLGADHRGVEAQLRVPPP